VTRAWRVMVRALPALAAAATLLMPASAPAHVDVKPERAAAGDEARLTFEVPNERADDATRRIVIQMPAGVTSVEALSLRGWRLTTRAQSDGVRRATLTAPRGRELSGEQRGRFRMSVGLPRRGGATLTFKVLQVYDSGEIVRWIGPAGTSEPAPTLRLTAPREPPPAEQPSDTETQPQTETAPATDTSDEGGDESGGVPIWAGIGLILLAAGAGSALARRRNRRRFEERYRS
jgi:periplasmic copper chaperone A